MKSKISKRLTDIPIGDLDVCFGVVVQRLNFNRWCVGNFRGILTLKDATTTMMGCLDNSGVCSVD